MNGIGDFALCSTQQAKNQMQCIWLSCSQPGQAGGQGYILLTTGVRIDTLATPIDLEKFGMQACFQPECWQADEGASFSLLA